MKQSTALSEVMGRDLTTILIHGLLFTPGGLRWTRVKHLWKKPLVIFVNKALGLKSVVDVNSPASRPGLVPPVMQPIRSKIIRTTACVIYFTYVSL